jgi:L-malate glycosyltransferase
MKIQHYIGSLHYGGIERLVYELAEEQIKSGLDVKILVGKEKGEFKEQYLHVIKQVNFINLKSGFDFRFKKFLFIKKQFKNSDIIHLHGFHLLVTLATIFSRKKIIYTEHGNFALGRKIKFSDKISHFLRKLFFNFTKVTICCNSNFTEQLVRSKLYTGKRLLTIHNGINLKKEINLNLYKLLKENYKGKFIIGTCSRLVGFKRIDRLINVFEKFYQLNSESILLIIGSGSELPKLKELVQKKNLNSVIHFLGYQSEISTYQSLFDISVFPSQNEPFGLVALECYHLQKPVLVFHDGGGICEIVTKQNPKDSCASESEMLKRLKFYQKNKIEVNTELLLFFDIKSMSRSYLNCYIN